MSFIMATLWIKGVKVEYNLNVFYAPWQQLKQNISKTKSTLYIIS